MTTAETQSEIFELGSSEDFHLLEIIPQSEILSAEISAQPLEDKNQPAVFVRAYNRSRQKVEELSRPRRIALAAGALAIIAGVGTETGRRVATRHS